MSSSAINKSVANEFEGFEKMVETQMQTLRAERDAAQSALLRSEQAMARLERSTEATMNLLWSASSFGFADNDGMSVFKQIPIELTHGTLGQMLRLLDGAAVPASIERATLGIIGNLCLDAELRTVCLEQLVPQHLPQLVVAAFERGRSGADAELTTRATYVMRSIVGSPSARAGLVAAGVLDTLAAPLQDTHEALELRCYMCEIVSHILLETKFGAWPMWGPIMQKLCTAPEHELQRQASDICAEHKAAVQEKLRQQCHSRPTMPPASTSTQQRARHHGNPYRQH